MFGELRLIEYEHILERISYTLLNVIMTSSMFKDSDITTILLFNLQYVFYKVLHWIMRDRMEFIFQVDLNHARVSDILFSRFMFNTCVLFLIDVSMTKLCFEGSLNGDSGHVYLSFAVQFGVLLLEIVHITLLSSLNLYEIVLVQKRARGHNTPDALFEEQDSTDGQNGNEFDEDEEAVGLEGKFIYEKLIEIIIGILKMMAEFPMLLASNMPVGGLFDFLWQAIHIFKSCGLLWKSWKGSKMLDSSLRTATDEQILSKEVETCIICMDDFLPSTLRKSESKKPKILPCGHALHLSCLKSWIERSPTCPICRLPIFDGSGNVADTVHEGVNENIEQQVNEGEQQVLEHSSDSGSLLQVDDASGLLSDGLRSTFVGHDTTENGWITVPIYHKSGDISNFRIITESGHEIEGTMRLKRKSYDNTGPITVPDNVLEENEGTSMKRKIVELENKIHELSKKIKKD